MPVLRTGILSLLLATGAAPPTAAQSLPRYDPTWHGGIAAAAVLGSGVLLLKDRRAAPDCRWCGVDEQRGTGVPRVDAWGRRRLEWGDEASARVLSHVTAGMAFAWPIVGLTAVHGGMRGDWRRDQIVAIGSVTVAQFVADLSKRTFRRARPHVVFDGAALRRVDDVHSFMSGHTATSFAAVVSTATIASRRGSRHANWIWIGGLGLAGSTGYLRVAANRHFLTDVLTGAVVGSTVGLLLPRVFDDPRQSAPAEPVAPPLAAIGPTARFGPTGAGATTLRIAAGARAFGLLGTVAIR